MPKLFIKNMVCPRCKSAVSKVMADLGLKVLSLELGEIEVNSEPLVDLHELDKRLRLQGFELLQERETQVVGQIKSLVLEYLLAIEYIKIKLSDFLSAKTNLSYNYLSKLFSQVENKTIEKYFIALRVEKVKEKLSYHEPLVQIAEELGYSSPQALSNQFKAQTGIRPKDFVKAGKFRKNLSDV